jgi:hypothetical protein
VGILSKMELQRAGGPGIAFETCATHSIFVRASFIVLVPFPGHKRLYLPMQNVEKIKLRMSSVVVSPVSESR